MYTYISTALSQRARGDFTPRVRASFAMTLGRCVELGRVCAVFSDLAAKSGRMRMPDLREGRDSARRCIAARTVKLHGLGRSR
jgi:hypothetical protein